jgi:hypothetical protein
MKKILLTLLYLSFAFLSCEQSKESSKTIVVANNLDLPRSFETVALTKKILALADSVSLERITIKDPESEHFLTTQVVDEDGDGVGDLLLFQPEVEAMSSKEFIIVVDGKFKADTTSYCYSRFVPERTDDYAWENNKVAFRTFGPTAQKLEEDDLEGGTLTSGIDAWLKKVDYSIINKWYEKTVSGKGTYHEDTGEGLDNFHVGVSRGVGGVAVKKDTTYYVSKNFTAWNRITKGPIRTSFTLHYADWNADGQKITEEKHISLDYGNNLSKFEIHVTGTDTLAVGLTLHENDGEITQNVKEGWISYWEPHDGSELGSAIIAPKGNMIASEYYLTSLKDQSNLYAQLKVRKQKVTYYAGFAWKESKQYPTRASWEKYVQEFGLKINTPLEVTIK